MRITIALMLAGLLAQAQETETNEEVVKAVRYVLSATKEKDRQKYYDELFARGDLDWPSVKKGLETGRYYQKPMSTEIGIRHSGKHMGIRLRGSDGNERGFSVYVPRGYTAEDDARIPVIFYLHHNAADSVDQGASKADLAIRKFDELCERENVLFVAPYTGKGGEWWTEEGLRLIRWTLENVKERYNIDENRVGLLGTLDAGSAVWYVAQNMPGTWNVIMPMTGNPYSMTAMVEPVYIGTIDRMDVLMGVPGNFRNRLGDKNIQSYLDWLKPHFDKHMRITLSVHTSANSDAHYLDRIREQIVSFTIADARKRRPLADEVDVETSDEDGLRSLWLAAHGYDPDIKAPHRFPSTRLVWTAPKRKEPKKRLGISLSKPNLPIGQVITRTSLGAQRAKIHNGDVLLEIDGTKITKDTNVAKLLEGKNWNDEVELLLAREVTEDELEGAQRQQRQIEQIRRKIAELKAQGKEIPADKTELLEDEPVDEGGEEEEEEDDGESVIEFGDEGGDTKPKKTAEEREETQYFVFRRWIKILRPEDVLIREDFGANWDRNYAGEPAGVRVASVVPGSLADQSGLKAGDVIVHVLGRGIKKMADLREAFESWKFEKEPEGKRSLSMTIQRMGSDRQWREDAVTVRWAVPKPYRVDAQWDRTENRVNVLARHASKFTIYLNDHFVEPGKPFHLFVNNVPYHDLISPETRPDYPKPRRGGFRGDQRYRMRMKRARIEEGWKPDFKLAVDDALETRDRGLVVGAKLEIDLTRHKSGFEKSRREGEAPQKKKGEKLEEAYGKYKAGGAPG